MKEKKMKPKEIMQSIDFEEVSKKVQDFLKKYYPDGHTIIVASTNGSQIFNGSHAYKPDLKCLIR